MTIIEVGLITSGGLPVSYVDFTGNSSADPIVKAGFFTAFKDLANTLFNDAPESFEMSKYSIVFQKVIIHDGEYSIYAITDNRSEVKQIKKRIIKITKIIHRDFKNLDEIDITTVKGSELSKVMEEEFKDFSEEVTDRAKRLFG